MVDEEKINELRAAGRVAGFRKILLTHKRVDQGRLAHIGPATKATSGKTPSG
jgi:hypothetical protein